MSDFLRQHQKHRLATDMKQRDQVNTLSRTLKSKEYALNNLYRAIEAGVVDLDMFPLRGGLFCDPTQAEGSLDEYCGFTLGSGIGYRQLIFDIAYQYHKGTTSVKTPCSKLDEARM